MISKKVLSLVAVLLLAVATMAMAQDMCVGDFDYDTDCDGTDAALFKSDFGRSGYTNPCPPDGPAPVPKTGQTTSYATGDDGDLRMGIARPNPRFTDNGDGTVTDNLTGLIWLRNANCFGQRTWNNAVSDCNGLVDGEDCGSGGVFVLSDGSSAGDWRLPNRNELNSLLDVRYFLPILCNTEGTGHHEATDPFWWVQNGLYWTSTNDARSPDGMWVVDLDYGYLDVENKVQSYNVWPVRGGHSPEAPYFISGLVLNEPGYSPIAGVAIEVAVHGGGVVATGLTISDGTYVINNVLEDGESFTVTTSKDGCTFMPPVVHINSVNENYSGIDFMGDCDI